MPTLFLDRIVIRLTICGAVLACAACAPVRQSQPSWAVATDARDQRITVIVENLVWSDVVVYSRVYGSTVRLGMVVAGDTGRFRIPKHHQVSHDLELFADPVGSSDGFTSDPVFAMPGQEVRWTVHRSAALRILTIW